MSVLGTDRDVLQTASRWLEEGHELALVTVLKTWGSSPRPPGSLMVMRRDRVHSGSVSGGCVEEDLLDRYRRHELSEPLPTQLNYGVSRQEATRYGLPCGGRLELLIEQLDDAAHLHGIIHAMDNYQLTARQVNTRTGEVKLKTACPDQEFSYQSEHVTKVFGPTWQMLLIGAGHLSHYVSQIAQMLGYYVVVCDPREEYTENWKVPGTELISIMPDEAVQIYATHPRSIVIALTHDPKLDDMALVEALASEAFYVGAIGSQRNCDQRRERLRQWGLSAAEVQRLHAPVGLAIGSHTPPEIAVSILAEITSLRNADTMKNRSITAA